MSSIDQEVRCLWVFTVSMVEKWCQPVDAGGRGTQKSWVVVWGRKTPGSQQLQAPVCWCAGCSLCPPLGLPVLSCPCRLLLILTLHRLPRILPLFTSSFAFCLQHRLDCGEALQSVVHSGTSQPSSLGERIILHWLQE